MITGIVIALAEEIGTLTCKKIVAGSCAFISSEILVAHSGAGPVNASKAAQQLIDNGAERIISWGCAAALDEQLTAGDLVLPLQLITVNQQTLSVDEGWHRDLLAQLSIFCTIHSGDLLGSQHIVSSAREKKDLAKRNTAIAVDMESVAVAETARQSNLPCLVIRAIADPANMDLPKAIDYAIEPNGNVNRRKIFRYLLLHPMDILGLVKLGLYFHSASKKLKLIANHIKTITNYTPGTVWQS